MNALLMVAHGSRLTSSNEEFADLAARVRAKLDGHYDALSTAFLELAEPGIAAGLQHLIDQGATRIDVMPCFLLAGTHVRHDIPEVVQQVQAAHPNLTIKLHDHLAAEPSFVDYLAAQALAGR